MINGLKNDFASEWNEKEEENAFLERMSGFRHSRYTNGYRNAVLEEYKHVTERGRQAGYEGALGLSFRDERQKPNASALCPALDASDSFAANPIRALSQAKGVLLGYQATSSRTLSEEDQCQIKRLVEKIDGFLSKIYTPVVEDFSTPGEHETKISSDLMNKKGILDFDSFSQCLRETKDLCKKFNWVINLDE